MDVYYCDEFVLPLPEGHRFPMSKYARLRLRVQRDPDLRDCRFLVPEPASRQALLEVHTPDYLERVLAGELTVSEQRRIGFPWSERMVERSRRSVGGTIGALGSAIDCGIAVNLAGGTHHADASHGAGYCVFNDAVVALRAQRKAGRAKRFLIVDLDVHHGDGTARLCAEDPLTYTFSMHSARSYPARKPDSDLDVALAAGVGDREYLTALDEHLGRAISAAQADAAVYLAGADPFKYDRLGDLGLSKAGLLKRDELVFSHLAEAQIPVAVVMAGGYAENIEDVVDIHHSTVCSAYRRLQGDSGAGGTLGRGG